MKIIPSAVITLVAVGSGFTAGWFCKPQAITHPAKEGIISTSARSRTSSASIAGPSSLFSKDSTSAVDSPESSLETHFASELKSLKRLSDTEFANRMADTWFARKETPANLLSKALFAEACDSGKAMAFYDEFKRRKGISGQEDGGSELWNFMFAVGQRHGAELIQKLTETHPEGILEMDTIVHGWVTAEPTQAVEWLNSLPENCPYYSRSLKGIVWGIGETAPDSAADTFLKLPAEERNQKFESLAGGVLSGHGMAGLNEIAAHLPDEKDRANLLMSSLPFAMKQPPVDFINGMAGNLVSVPELSNSFQPMTERWVKTSPSDAIAWLDKNADDPAQAPALGIMASQLSQAGFGAAVDSWLASHPQSRARSTVETIRRQGKQ